MTHPQDQYPPQDARTLPTRDHDASEALLERVRQAAATGTALRLVGGGSKGFYGRPVVGGCIVLNRWHCHTDRSGQFHWSVEAPVPDKVKVKSYKRYVGKYVPYEATISLSKLESQAIVLKLQ